MIWLNVRPQSLPVRHRTFAGVGVGGGDDKVSGVADALALRLEVVGASSITFFDLKELGRSAAVARSLAFIQEV